MLPHDWPAFLSLVKRIVVANRNIAIEREQAQPLVAPFLFHVKRCVFLLGRLANHSPTKQATLTVCPYM